MHFFLIHVQFSNLGRFNPLCTVVMRCTLKPENLICYCLVSVLVALYVRETLWETYIMCLECHYACALDKSLFSSSVHYGNINFGWGS